MTDATSYWLCGVHLWKIQAEMEDGYGEMENGRMKYGGDGVKE